MTHYIKGFSRLVTSTAAPIATGWNDSRRVGLAPTERSRLCTAHQDLEIPVRLPGALRLYRGRTCPLPAVLPVVQHRSSAFRYRPDDTRGRALRNRRCPHAATRRHARRRVCRQSDPLQGSRADAARTAHLRVDQSPEKGLDTDPHHTRLLSNLLTPGVSKSLTRSGSTPRNSTPA